MLSLRRSTQSSASGESDISAVRNILTVGKITCPHCSSGNDVDVLSILVQLLLHLPIARS